MIKRILYVICDSCEAKLEVPKEQIYGEERESADSWAEDHGWHNWRKEHRDSRHYCPNCKVPVKLAKAMEAMKCP